MRKNVRKTKQQNENINKGIVFGSKKLKFKMRGEVIINLSQSAVMCCYV